jgi:hypothetical protein
MMIVARSCFPDFALSLDTASAFRLLKMTPLTRLARFLGGSEENQRQA